MASYVKRFQQLAEELRKHPEVELLTFELFPPVPEDCFNQIETHYRLILDTAIRDFYSQTNGLQIRWISKKNEQFNPQLHHYIEKEINWSHGIDSYQPEEASIFLLPLTTIFPITPNNAPRIGINKPLEAPPITFLDGEYAANQFFDNIYPFDVFSKICRMAFFKKLGSNNALIVLLGDEEGWCYTDSKITDFASYLEFLLATKGICQKRKAFYGVYQGYTLPEVHTPKKFWTAKKRVALQTFLFSQEFHLADQDGSNTHTINTLGMQEKAFKANPVTPQQLFKAIDAHTLFLKTGGSGGHWQTVALRSFVVGIYSNHQHQEGTQAIFDFQHFAQNLDLQELQLPYSSWCGVYARYQDFTEANLMGSLFSDAMLEQTLFVEANLEKVDFSRSNLRGANFMNANLRGADFENCDLTGADFTGAILDGARFPGAILKNVIR